MEINIGIGLARLRVVMGWHILNQIIANNVGTKGKRQWMMFMMMDQIMPSARNVDFASSVVTAKSLDVGGKMGRVNCTGWLIGYFVVLAPLNFIHSWHPVSALIHGIIGVAGAILFLRWGRR